MPYRLLAGVVPCPGGWLAISGKLHGINLLADRATVFERFAEVLEHRPAFDVVALYAPIGLPTAATPGGRACDRAARELLGWPRAGAVISAPPRRVLDAKTFESARRRHPTLSPVEFGQLARIAEVDQAIKSFHQRTVHEIHPELSYHQLTDGHGLQHPKHSPAGRAERRALLEPKLQGIGSLLDRRARGSSLDNRLDAAVALWTARRIASRGVLRIPQEADWDERGLRMEIVR
jgi:predicted RNase H-like nuclease